MGGRRYEHASEPPRRARHPRQGPRARHLARCASTWTATLTALIEAHREAWTAFGLAVEALEVAEPDKETVIPGVGAAPYPVKGHRYEEIKAYIEDDFAEELEKTTTLSALSPESATPCLPTIVSCRGTRPTRSADDPPWFL
jgi:hypothetical protein